MWKCIIVAAAVVVSLPRTSLHAGNLDRLLATCRNACDSLPGSVTITLTCQHGQWQITGIESSSAEGSVTDESLVSLNTLTTLDSLVLETRSLHLREEYTGLTPKAFRMLSTLQLRRLRLAGDVAGDDLQGICFLGSLEALQLVGYSGKKMPQDDLQRLRHLKNLRRLEVSRMRLSDTSLKGIEVLGMIEELSLLGVGITAERVETLGNLQNLRSISLASLDAKGVAVLEGLPHLECLDVVVYDLSSGKADLSGLGSLKWLNIGLSSTDSAVRVYLPNSLRRLAAYADEEEQIDWTLAPQIEYVEVKDRGGYPLEGIGNLLKRLHSLPNLKVVRLNRAVDESVSQLAEFPNLRDIELKSPCPRDEWFGDEGMKALAGLRNIESFTIHTYGSNMTDSGLKVLQNFPKLRQLTLTRCYRLTTEGLAIIPGLGQLRSLTLLYSGYTPDSSLDQVANAIQVATQVEELHLGGRMLSDSGLRHLANLKNVRRLDVSETQGYSEKGLVRLILELPNLEYLKFALPRSTSRVDAAP